MKILIILNGEIKSQTFLKNLAQESDYIICADGGYDKAKAAGVMPDLLLGDMDSVQAKDFDGKILQFPPEKDWTDCELALKTAYDMQADEIVVTCALGGRCDHEMANLYVLSSFENACIKEKDVSVYVCDRKLKFEGNGKVFSILPLSDSVVSVSGAKYCTEKALFKVGASLGISNEATEAATTVQVFEGKCLIFINESDR